MKKLSTDTPRGFALVTTLVLMLLLGILAIGMLSLSSISMRSSSHNSAMSEARSNARMALMLAIGELQKSTGPDTRITAPADIADAGAPPLTGVWKSWEGTDHDPITGRPTKPDYSGKAKSDANSGRFLQWLVSGAVAGSDPSATGNKPSDLVSTTALANTVPLLSGGTLGSNPGQVHVKPQLVNNDRGALAWWVSPENQKARLIQPHKPRSTDVAGWSDMGKTHSAPDPKPFGLDSLVSDPENHSPDPNNPKSAGKAITLASTELIVDGNPANPQQSFHDLSTSSIGLLTNTATGGWRKDMSLLTEKWDDIYTKFPSAKLPLFRYLPGAGKASLVPRPTSVSYEPTQSNFYPWSEYSQIGANKLPITYGAASASWQSLVNFATKYKSVSYNATSKACTAPIGWDNIVSSKTAYNFTNDDFFKQYHDLALNPVVARVQLIFQANALKDLNPYETIENPDLFYRLNLRIVPVITLWNPYNVEITKAAGGLEYGISTTRSLPLGLSITNATAPPTGAASSYYKLINDGSITYVDSLGAPSNNKFDRQIQLPGTYAGGVHFGSIREMCAWLPKQFSLKPGEAKVFTPQQDTGSDTSSIQYYFAQLLKEGYSTGDDYGMVLTKPEGMPIATARTSAADYGTLNNSRDYRHILASRFVQVPTNRTDLSARPVASTLLKPTTIPPKQTNPLYATDVVKFEVKADRLSKIFTDSITAKNGAGIDFMVGTMPPAFGQSGGRTAVENGITNLGMSRFHSVQAISIDPTWAKQYWPANELEKREVLVSDIIPGGGNRPWTSLFSVSFGPRLSFGAAAGNPQNRPTKGLLQSNPFANNAFSIPDQTTGNHPANGAYDISYNTIKDGDDGFTPEVGTAGYIASGFKLGDGISRLIMAEIPLRPMASLAELQSWNLRGNNPFPPHQYNLIGNSDATPLIVKDSILPATPATTNVATNLQHDDAYCANHLLFDDWFFSSIAPEPTNFGQAISKDIESVYRDYLMGSRELTNRAYRPIAEDRALTTTLASQRIAEIVNSPGGDGWLKVASRFEVDGMFNVNSTSVTAWRALLGHARQQQVAHHSAAGMVLDPQNYDHVVSRHSVASDVKAGAAPGIGAAFPSGSEYTGFRTLSDTQLDELAKKVVDQVRLRGPFLSLSEFVNRQLSSDDDKALAGALQAALDSLSDDPMAVLKNPANQLSDTTMDPADNKMIGAGYAFDKAAAGMSTHGFPGWIRQADVLRPIAPILSARDDTFTIRAYGDARDADGKVTARAWCEATVQRNRSFVNDQDKADYIDTPTNIQNQLFGRKYNCVSFRWLSFDEI